MTNKLNSSSIALIGAGGHAQVCFDIVKLTGKAVNFVVTKTKTPFETIEGASNLTDEEFLSQASPSNVLLVNGIGHMPSKKQTARKDIYKKYKRLGFTFLTLKHPSATIAGTSFIGEGAHIMAGCVIQPNAKILENTIVNTKTSVDHDSYIGANVHIAPGTTICGNVKIGEGCFIGAGSTIIQNIELESDTILPAGSILKW